MKDENIAAIASAFGNAAISIIRLTGKSVINEVNKIFHGINLEKQKSHTIHYGKIIVNNELIDEVMVSIYREPKSYTGENMIEIFCHGGVVITDNVLNTLLLQKVRMAEPGEFTKRAYLNKKMDLIKAESVMDIISAQNSKALRVAKQGIDSKLSLKINNYKQRIMTWIANIEVNIDYPEYEDEKSLGNDFLKPQLTLLAKEMNKLIDESKKNLIVLKGIKTVIIGKPNVGKSTLLNTLINEDKAIVSSTPGTTRDSVEGVVNLGGLFLELVDTAGIRSKVNHIERKGISKTLEQIEKSQLVLFVIDGSKEIDKQDLKIYNLIKRKKHIIISNKSDLPVKKNEFNSIQLSAKNKVGIDQIESHILDLFRLNDIDTRDVNFLSNKRQIKLLEKAFKSITSAISSIENLVPIDMVQLDLKSAWQELSEITGSTFQENLLNEMFKNFCLGKWKISMI